MVSSSFERHIILSTLFSNVYAQAPESFPRTPPTRPDSHAKPIIAPVFATGMKCDGSTDDSAALQAALNLGRGRPLPGRAMAP